MKIKGLSQTIAAWKMLLGSLPRGIVAFVIAVAGLSIGLPLALFVIGIPILVGMLAACERIMGVDRRLVANWESNGEYTSGSSRMGLPESGAGLVQGGLKSWVSSLGNVQRYRNLAYGIGQFPVSILAFVLAIVIPATTLALLLSPVAEIVSSRIFSFNLFEQDLIMKWLFPDWSSFQRSWFNTGLGVILLLSMPFLFRKLGQCYAAWIRWISGTPSHT